MFGMKRVDLERKRGIYLLPSLFTSAALFSGFYAVISSMRGQYEASAIAIFIAIMFDSLDGRVARLTGTESSFGAEYDSLSDMVSFGIAPALIVYNWGLNELGKIGWLAAFIFAVSAALRLARFNTHIGKGDREYFQGLASPAAAAIVAGMVWLGQDFSLNVHHLDYLAVFITIVSGLLMVSNFRYHSFKNINLKKRVLFIGALVIVLILVAAISQPALAMFLVFATYAISGPIYTIRSVFKLKLKQVISKNVHSIDFGDEKIKTTSISHLKEKYFEDYQE